MRLKLSKTNQNHYVSPETRKKISEAKKGKKRPPCSDETRKKLSEANKRRKTCGSRKGQKTSEETKIKISKALKGRKLNPEVYKKRTQSRLNKNNGKYFSEEGLNKLKQTKK